MSDKISKLIGKTFNTDIGSNYGISGRQKISTQFTIDKYGNVTDIKTRGPHPALEKEANRVINKIPKMQPGLQRHGSRRCHLYVTYSFRCKKLSLEPNLFSRTVIL